MEAATASGWYDYDVDELLTQHMILASLQTDSSHVSVVMQL